MQIQWKKLLLSLLIPILVGLFSSFFIRDSITSYMNMQKPPLAPPSFLFPIVWSILYILMGISCYLILITSSPLRPKALLLYGIQLFLNFLWSPVFFNLQSPFFALIILVLLWSTLFQMLRVFLKISPIAAWLQVPYLIWCTFAAYLNLGILLLN